MNKKCNNEDCIYFKTCLIDNYKSKKKYTGQLSVKKTQHHNYQDIKRGNDEKKKKIKK